MDLGKLILIFKWCTRLVARTLLFPSRGEGSKPSCTTKFMTIGVNLSIASVNNIDKLNEIECYTNYSEDYPVRVHFPFSNWDVLVDSDDMYDIDGSRIEGYKVLLIRKMKIMNEVETAIPDSKNRRTDFKL